MFVLTEVYTWSIPSISLIRVISHLLNTLIFNIIPYLLQVSQVVSSIQTFRLNAVGISHLPHVRVEPTHYVHLDLTIHRIFNERYKSLSSSLCSFFLSFWGAPELLY